MVHLLCAVFLFNGMTGKIQGTVKNEDTGEPVPYATVRLLNTEIGAAADDQGNFYILNVPSGVYTVEFSSIGYQIKSVERVVVEIDQVVRLKISLRSATIDLPSVTVVSETPILKKDMVATTYYIRKSEIKTIPFDYIANVVNIQPSVAHIDTAVHVRGGRADEVLYMIDNISITDPQTGDLAVSMSKGLIDEVIFLPGNFDAEYGRAMSGVVNLITTLPAEHIKGSISTKTEKIMPLYYDFGYQTYQAYLHLPASSRVRTFISFDGMQTNDWDPRLYVQPHKQRDDYSLYGKVHVNIARNLKLTLSGIKSRSQFDRYLWNWKFWLDHYRSDMRNGNLEAININYLPAPHYYMNLTFSHLYTEKIYGMREEKATAFLSDYQFHDYRTLRWPTPSNDNPFGVYYPYFYCTGDFPEYQDKRSRIIKGAMSANMQLGKNHELKTGADYSCLDLSNFTSYLSDSLHSIVDDYGFKPRETSIYIQDNIDYEGFYAKVGMRGDFFSPGIDTISSKISVSPRLGFSFMVTDKFLFRANIGQYCQPPLYDQLYTGTNLFPIPSFLLKIPLIGNPNLRPEKTKSYEVGLQGEIRKDMSITFNAFNKEISDLIGTRYVKALPRGYVEYKNIEYASVRGVESILEFSGSTFFTGKISYTLSWARGTSSYATEVYYRYYKNLDTATVDTGFVPPMQEYKLDFDQRNRIFVQGIFNFPQEIKLYIFGYLGNGFPYTPPGPEGKLVERNIHVLSLQKELDCVILKAITFRKFHCNASIEIINLLDERYQIADMYTMISPDKIKPQDFEGYYFPISNTNYYRPGMDPNHDGLVTSREYYESYVAINQASEDWVSSYNAPRRLRVGLEVNF